MVTSTPTSNNHRHQPCHPQYVLVSAYTLKLGHVGSSNVDDAKATKGPTWTKWDGKTHRVVKQHKLGGKWTMKLREICCCFIWKYPDHPHDCTWFIDVFLQTQLKKVSSMHMSLQFHRWSLMMFADLFSRIVSHHACCFPKKMWYFSHTHTKIVLKHDTSREKSNGLEYLDCLGESLGPLDPRLHRNCSGRQGISVYRREHPWHGEGKKRKDLEG